MITCGYETIPTAPDEDVERFEWHQRISEPALRPSCHDRGARLFIVRQGVWWKSVLPRFLWLWTGLSLNRPAIPYAIHLHLPLDRIIYPARTTAITRVSRQCPLLLPSPF